jgi:hypothetical protein
MNTMSSHDTSAVRQRGHNFVTGDDRREFPGRRKSGEGIAEEALSTVKQAARSAGGWLFASPLLALAVIAGVGYLMSRAFDSRR